VQKSPLFSIMRIARIGSETSFTLLVNWPWRGLLASVWLPMLFTMVFLTVPAGTEAAGVWSGPKIVFTKADTADPKQPDNQDRITPNVWLTRGASQGLYNVAREASFTRSVSPADTEWASGTTANFASLKYTDWETWAKSVGNPPATPGVNAVLHLKKDDVFIDIKFLSWSERAGGFSYERSTEGAAVALPGSPSIGEVSPGNGSAIVTFTPPDGSGGTNISSYLATCVPGSITATAVSSPITVVGLTNGVTYSCSVAATNSAGTGAPSATVAVTPAAPQIAVNLSFVSGWNLVGNAIEAPISVVSVFNDPTKVNSVWKWVASKTKWAFYTPTQSDRGAVFAASEGYEVLETVGGGEGFWVNATAAFSVPLPSGTAVESLSFKPAFSNPVFAGGVHALPSGWSLISTGDVPTPTQFNALIATGSPATPTAAGNLDINLTALWAWNASKQKWYFWAPSLVNSGELTTYIGSKDYLDFSTIPTVPVGTISPTTGFWVSRP
jgi:hypothetical protein